MTSTFNSAAIDRNGWRQGAVLGPDLLRVARERAPSGIIVADDNWLIVTSHHCDIVNPRLDKEPSIEVLRAEVVTRKKLDKQQVFGRNPRVMEFEVRDSAGGPSVILSVNVHERWPLPREILTDEAPARLLEDKERRLIAEWLAKRYIRAAFPTAFDGRWRTKMGDWTRLLEKHSAWIQGVYLRLNTLQELPEDAQYVVDIIVAAPAAATSTTGWATKRLEIEEDVESFWKQFGIGIECAGVDVLGTDNVTLAEIEAYQRFDADWVSFADDTPAMPPAVDMIA